jgi:RHS repeat-associated protein
VFVYAGGNVFVERTVRGGGVREGGGLKLGSRYVWGEDLSGTLQGAGGIGGLLSSVQVGAATGAEAEGTTSFFHYDSNGNVILLTDGRGRESARYSYDAFGKTLTATGLAAGVNRYRFSTKPVEEESGLVYYGYRYYDPVTGRWPSRDPIGEMGGLNLYTAGANGPVNNVDVLGGWVLQAMLQGLDAALEFVQNRCGSANDCKACCYALKNARVVLAAILGAVDIFESMAEGAAIAGFVGGAISAAASFGITYMTMDNIYKDYESCVQACDCLT